jgi:hypothetical protein
VGDSGASSNINLKTGSVNVGEASVRRGKLAIYNGTSTNTPGCLILYALNGTPYFVFVENDMTLKISATLPTADADGSVIGAQT